MKTETKLLTLIATIIFSSFIGFVILLMTKQEKVLNFIEIHDSFFQGFLFLIILIIGLLGAIIEFNKSLNK